MLRPILPGLLPSPVPERRRRDPDWRDERWEDEQSVAATAGSVRVWRVVAGCASARCRCIVKIVTPVVPAPNEPEDVNGGHLPLRTFPISPEPLPLPRKSPSRTFAL